MGRDRDRFLLGMFERSTIWLAGGYFAATAIVAYLWFAGYDPESYAYLRGLSYQELTKGLLMAALSMFAVWVLIVIDRRVDEQAEAIGRLASLAEDHGEATVSAGELLAEHTQALVDLLEATQDLIAEVRALRAEDDDIDLFEEDDDDALDLDDDVFFDDEEDEVYLDADDLDDEVAAVPDRGADGRSPIRASC